MEVRITYCRGLRILLGMVDCRWLCENQVLWNQLFTIYVNDLGTRIKFADDTKLSGVVKNGGRCKEFSSRLNV